MFFKKEHFAGMTEEDKEPSFWEAVISMHNADDEAHDALFSAIRQSLLSHTGGEGLHLSKAEHELLLELKGQFEEVGRMHAEVLILKDDVSSMSAQAQEAQERASAARDVAERASENASFYRENAQAAYLEVERLSGEAALNAESASVSREAAEKAAETVVNAVGDIDAALSEFEAMAEGLIGGAEA